ncbi:hypothetical protein Q9966_015702 [Columba livia]|nr:hypothetical protein Q9966_015702 [Columba livia]
MIILGLVFLVQFGVSCSCLAIDRSRQEQLFSSAWHILSNETRAELERRLDCCGLRNRSAPPRRAAPLPRRLQERPRRALPDLRRQDAAALGRGAEDTGGGRLVLQLHRDPGGLVGHALPQPEGPARQPQRLPIAGGSLSLLGGGVTALLGGGGPVPPGWVLSIFGGAGPSRHVPQQLIGHLPPPQPHEASGGRGSAQGGPGATPTLGGTQ